MMRLITEYDLKMSKELDKWEDVSRRRMPLTRRCT